MSEVEFAFLIVVVAAVFVVGADLFCASRRGGR